MNGQEGVTYDDLFELNTREGRIAHRSRVDRSCPSLWKL